MSKKKAVEELSTPIEPGAWLCPTCGNKSTDKVCAVDGTKQEAK